MRGFDQIARREAPKLLEKVTGLPVRVEEPPGRKAGKPGPDLVFRAGGFRFLTEIKSSGAAAPVALAIQHLRGLLPKERKDTIPLLVVPYMGDTGRARCLLENISWLDLSGNAWIKAPALLVAVQVHPNRFKAKGRPSTVFAPKSSRVARELLLSEAPLTQREISRRTGLGEGYVSRIARRLLEDGLLVREKNDKLAVRDRVVLLDSWRETYDFSKHQIIAGHVAARSSEELLRDLARAFSKEKISYAATGLAGAWLYSHFAQHRLVTVYLSALPEQGLLEKIGFRADEQGANVWLVVPNDGGVFSGSQEREGIRCACPLQVYLDLKGHHERSAEAAAELRRKFLNWRSHA